MSTNRVSSKRGAAPSRMPKGPNGRPLCRQCGQEIPQGQRRRTFCSDQCVHEWRIKTDPGYVRFAVYERDQGVCSLCGLDTVALEREMWRWIGERKDARTYRWHDADRWKTDHGIPSNRQTFWDADHIVPVVEGGGECDLDNYRTLCIPCHRRVTAELRARLAEGNRPEPEPSPQLSLFGEEGH